MLEALTKFQFNRKTEALAHLKEALKRSEGHGYKALFLDEAVLLEELLEYAQANQCEAQKCKQLLAEIDEERAPSDSTKENQKIIDSLTKREKEILVQIEKGLPNKKIASELFITESTVKSHTQNLYAKLSVSSRTQAIIKAKSIGFFNLEGLSKED